MADRVDEVRAVHRVEVEVVDALVYEVEHLLGGHGGSHEAAGLDVVVQALEPGGEPVGHRGAGAAGEVRGLLEVLHRQDARDDRDGDPGRADLVEVAGAAGVVGGTLYGPAEFTVDAAAAPIAPGEVVIGRPVANVTARVLDASLSPVPPGAEGELYLSGPSEAHGYVGRAAETAASFVPGPWASGSPM